MFNYIKSDCYRVFRSKGFVIMFLLLVALSFIDAKLRFTESFNFINIGNQKSEKFIVEKILNEELAKKYIEDLDDGLVQSVCYNFFVMASNIDDFDDLENSEYSYYFIADLDDNGKVTATEEKTQRQRIEFVKKSRAVWLSLEPTEKELNLVRFRDAPNLSWDEQNKVCGGILKRLSPSDALYLLKENPSDNVSLYYFKTYGSVAPIKALLGGAIFMYFVLGFCGMFLMSEYGFHTFKNSLSSGFSRSKVFIVKFLEIWVSSMLLYLLFAGIMGLFGTMLNGFGGFSLNIVTAYFSGFLTQQCCFLFLTAFVTFLAHLFKRSASVNVCYIISFFAYFMFLFLYTSFTRPRSEEELATYVPDWLTRFEFTTVFINEATPEYITSDYYFAYILFPLASAFVLIFGGYALFRKAEVK